MNMKKPVNRRHFLKKTAGITAGVIGFPYLVRSSALGKAGTVAPSNRIVMGAIGTGGMGKGDLGGFLNKKEVQVVAVCDVDSIHSAQAKKMVDESYGTGDCGEYMDYRDLLGRGDLDAVMHALPDHWHGIVSVACARAGLDIFGQKPLARTIKGGRAICDAVKRYGRIWQTGSWQRSVAHFHKAAELVHTGRIGKVKYIEVGLPGDSGFQMYRDRGPVFPKREVPKNLNYNMWLGPAPWREYTGFEGTIHFDWRWVMDYSGGGNLRTGRVTISILLIGGWVSIIQVRLRSRKQRASTRKKALMMFLMLTGLSVRMLMVLISWWPMVYSYRMGWGRVGMVRTASGFSSTAAALKPVRIRSCDQWSDRAKSDFIRAATISRTSSIVLKAEEKR